MPLVFMTMPGNFLVASMATDLLKLSEGSYGIIASLPAWCNIIQLFAIPFMTRRVSQKSICLAFSWVHLICWILLGAALPYIPHDGSWPAVVFMISLFGASSFAFAIINISWTSWIQEWLPKRSRGKYLGRRNRILQCGMVLFLIAASQTIKAFTETNLTLGFQWIIATGILLRSISIVLQQRIYSREDASVDRTGSLASKFTIILKHKSLFRFILFGAAFGLTANFMGPFFSSVHAKGAWDDDQRSRLCGHDCHYNRSPIDDGLGKARRPPWLPTLPHRRPIILDDQRLSLHLDLSQYSLARVFDIRYRGNVRSWFSLRILHHDPQARSARSQNCFDQSQPSRNIANRSPFPHRRRISHRMGPNANRRFS